MNTIRFETGSVSLQFESGRGALKGLKKLLMAKKAPPNPSLSPRAELVVEDVHVEVVPVLAQGHLLAEVGGDAVVQGLQGDEQRGASDQGRTYVTTKQI